MDSEAISYPARCAHCQTEIRSPVICETCNALQPVGDQVDLFELLQLPVTYHLDIDQLEDVYLRLTRMIHPDYFEQTPGPEKSLSEDLAARINNAYRRLKDPLRRSEYLLRRAGGKSPSEDKRVAPEVLAEVLELRERIEQIRQTGRLDDLVELNEQLQRGTREAFDRLGQLHTQLESARAAADEARAQELLGGIRLTLNGIRYLLGLVRESTT